MSGAFPVRISVVLCTYNGERYLPAQLDSLLAQSRLPDEIVVLDDVSGDGTFDLLQAFADSARGRGIDVLLQRNERNLGYLRNFERALSLAGGDLLFLCDQDDVWHAEKTAVIEREFAARPDVLLVHSDARLIDGQGAPLPLGLFGALRLTAAERALTRQGRAFEVLLRRNIVTGATAALRRALLARAFPFPESWVHDEWLAVLAAARGGLRTLERPLIDYRQHAGNQIGLQLDHAVEGKPRGRFDRRAHFRRIHQRLSHLQHDVLRAGDELQPRWRALLADACRHAALRAELPRRWPARTARVLAELARGGYHAFSFGTRSAVADLLALP